MCSNQEQTKTEEQIKPEETIAKMEAANGKIIKFKAEEDKALGILSLSPSGLTECFGAINGSEGHKAIIITNAMDDDIGIHFQCGENKGQRKRLKSGLSAIYSRKTKDGLLGTTTFQCEFWVKDKYAKLFVYGEEAPRDDNEYQVKDKGIVLLRNNRELLLTKWEHHDQVDLKLESQMDERPHNHFLDNIHKLFP